MPHARANMITCKKFRSIAQELTKIAASENFDIIRFSFTLAYMEMEVTWSVFRWAPPYYEPLFACPCVLKIVHFSVLPPPVHFSVPTLYVSPSSKLNGTQGHQDNGPMGHQDTGTLGHRDTRTMFMRFVCPPLCMCFVWPP